MSFFPLFASFISLLRERGLGGFCGQVSGKTHFLAHFEQIRAISDN
jgi:hypothetical protein